MLGFHSRDLSAFAAAAACLGAMIVVGSQRARDPADNQAYFTAVARSISEIPYRIGPWIGADVEVQLPAIQLLRPNKLLQRRFTKSDGSETFSLLFVHCSDARDMQGHYPPICYPAHGWVIEESTRSDFVLGQFRVPCTIYRLVAIRQGERRAMTILNFFAVPSEEEVLAADMDAVNRASAASERAWLGSAQIQLILPENASIDDMSRLMADVGPAIEPAIWKVVHGARTVDE